MRFILFFFYVLIYVQMYAQYIYMQGLLNLILRIYLFNEMFICGVYLHKKLLGIKIVISLIQFSQKVNWMTTHRNGNFNCIQIFKKLYQCSFQQDTETKILNLNKTKSCDKCMSELENYSIKTLLGFSNSCYNILQYITIYENASTHVSSSSIDWLLRRFLYFCLSAESKENIFARFLGFDFMP